jgi:hypothetical protein
MPKSKYPNQLDSSAELPPVRDNITEIGSDVINSLRSAIIQIERTLGINPQGAAGNNLAVRLSRALDDNGNIKSDALDRANVLSGPIIDADVSRVAAIKETKLKLDFPTTLLQDEISMINGELRNIVAQVEELNVLLSVHLTPEALDRHPAIAISVDSADVVASDVSSTSLPGGTSQSVWETIYNAHINYTGANLSSTNNSHLASQIYYDNTDTSSVILSGSVQGAIDDLASQEDAGFRNALLNLHSNGRIRTGTVSDNFEGVSTNSVLIDAASATYIQAAGSSRSTFTLDIPTAPIEDISEFDILTLSGSLNTDDNKDYNISKVTDDGSGNITSIEVFGGPESDSTSGLFVTITKNQYVNYNLAGFSTTVRPRVEKSNTPDIQVANPDSATAITSGLNPSALLSDAHTFDISIDSGTAITLDTYDSTVSKQTVNSVINKVNEQCVAQHLNITAYKVLVGNCHEMALIHNVPNISGDFINRTITISAGTADDGTTTLGFVDLLGVTIEGTTGNSLHLNGNVITGFGLIKTFTDSQIALTTGALTLSLFSGTFAESGVRVGDLAVVSGSDTLSDDGSYRIASINAGLASLDLAGTTFSGSLDSGALVHIIRSGAPIGELTFEEIGSVNGTIMFDVFMTENKDLHYSKRMEVDGELSSGSFSGVVSDVSKGFITSGITSTLTIGTDGYAVLTGPDLQDGPSVYVAVTGQYEVFANDGLSFITLEINASGTPLLELSAELFGFDEISSNNYRIARGSFATSLGRVLGESTDPGIPSVIDKRQSGTADATIVGESFIEKYIEGPRNELRGNGVIRGCLVSNVVFDDTGATTFQTFDIGAGIIVINGIRYEFPGLTNFRIDTSDNFYVAIDSQGCVIADVEVTHPITSESVSPFFDQEIATLSFVENDGSAITDTVDLRLFVDNIDYKILGEVIVSPDQRFGHFTDIGKAVKYAGRIDKMFPDIGQASVYIKEGNYTVTEQIIVDFNCVIRGSGPNTQIQKGGSFAAGVPFNGSDVDIKTAMFLVGSGPDTIANDINRGVTFRDFVYGTNASETTYVSCAFAIVQDVSNRNNNFFVFDNIRFIGPENVDGRATTPDEDKIGEYALVVGRQDPVTLAPRANHISGNVTMSNCRMRHMGLERGAIKVLESSGGFFRNSVFHGNVLTQMSRHNVDDDFVMIEYPTTATVEQVFEIGNVSR